MPPSIGPLELGRCPHCRHSATTARPETVSTSTTALPLVCPASNSTSVVAARGTAAASVNGTLPRSARNERFGHGDSFGEGTEAGHEGRAVDLVPGLDGRDAAAGGAHDPVEVAAGNVEGRAPEADLQAGQVRDAPDEVPVGGVERGSVDVDDDLSGSERGGSTPARRRTSVGRPQPAQ